MNTTTRNEYATLRRTFREWRRQLLNHPAAFERCLILNSQARNLTGRWETGFCSPTPRITYARRGCWQPVVTPALSRFLSRN